MGFTIAKSVRSAAALLTLLCWISPLPGQTPVPRPFSEPAWAREMFRVPVDRIYLPEFNDSYGVVFRDLNRDELADLYVVRFRDLNRLFINQGRDAAFLDFTIPSGLGGNLMASGKQNLELGASSADFNNDGKEDILIVGWGLTTYLFEQRGNLNFPAKIPFAEDYFPLDGNAGIWADVNRDGKLDLFITDEHYQNRFFINKEARRFVYKSVDYNLNLQATSQGAAFADVDGDDYPDLYVCNWFAADVFYRNVGGVRFEPVELSLPHTQLALNSNSASFGDLDNDGDLDMIVADRDGSTRLYRNELLPHSRAWEFTDFTEPAGIRNPYPAYSSVIADFNNDGWQDIFFANIGPNLLFLNSDSGKFRLAYAETVPPQTASVLYSTGAAVADMDNDGDLDLFVANKDTLSVLYQNPLDNANFLRFRLEGVKSNRNAVGAKIWLYRAAASGKPASLAGYREIGSSAGYLSASELVAHFGAAAGELYNARVRFPSGKEISLQNLLPGKVYQVSETGGIRKTFLRAFQHLSLIVLREGFWLNALLFLMVVGLISGFIIFSIRRYHWQNNQTALFLIGAIALGYLLFLLLSGYPTWLILLAQLGALLTFMILISGFNEKIQRLEAQRYGYRQLLQEFSQQLIFIKNNDELYREITAAIQRSMKVDYCCALEVKNIEPGANSAAAPGAVACFKTAAGNWKDEPARMALSQELLNRLVQEAVINVSSAENASFALAGGRPRLVLSLARKEKLFALLLLGERENGRDFVGEDLGILEILVRQAAIAIENNLYIEESKTLAQKLTAAEVREQYVAELETKNQSLERLFRELQDTQTQLIQSEKMAALGQLVAGIAHELNNPISFVYANMKELQQYTRAISELLETLSGSLSRREFQQQLQEKLAELDQKYDLAFIQKDIDNLIGESLVGSQRVKDVVQNLRNFSRLDEAEYKEVDLHDGLESTLLLLNNELKNRIEVHKNYGKLPKVHCNPGQINQVFMNLLLNAAQAIPGKGEIRIATRQNGAEVEIEIRDSGKGIPESIRSKIFDPFFTTKAVGKGTGLGLSISYNIIQKHGGRILLESAEGKGSVFTVVLPLGAEGRAHSA